jgi:low affinity Fe/Cu permease
MREAFRRFANAISRAVGSPWAFAAALGICATWAVSGPLFGFSDSWQLVINTGTTIVTFLMVFLIQNTQNRDGIAIQLKLDELLRAVAAARNRLVDLEEVSDEEIERLQREFKWLRLKASGEGDAAQSKPPRGGSNPDEVEGTPRSRRDRRAGRSRPRGRSRARRAGPRRAD